jgi:hypothetical protein
VLTVDDTETVGHESGNTIDEQFGELSAFGLIVRHLSSIKPDILQEQDVTRGERAPLGDSVWADRIGRELDCCFEEFAETFGNRRE